MEETIHCEIKTLTRKMVETRHTTWLWNNWHAKFIVLTPTILDFGAFVVTENFLQITSEANSENQSFRTTVWSQVLGRHSVKQKTYQKSQNLLILPDSGVPRWRWWRRWWCWSQAGWWGMVILWLWARQGMVSTTSVIHFVEFFVLSLLFFHFYPPVLDPVCYAN